MKVNLSGVPETLFITLRIRAIEAKRPDAAVKDPYAVQILEQIEFDESSKNKVSEASQTGTIVRTIILDEIINDFCIGIRKELSLIWVAAWMPAASGSP